MSQIYDVLKRDAAIVFVGGFDSQKYTPEWLHHFDIINEQDFENSELKVLSIHECFTKLEWCSIHVLPASKEESKLVITLTDAGSFQLFVDLVHSIIELNDVSVFTALGINFSHQITHESTTEWNDWGHRLLPPSEWTKAFTDDESKHSGMRAISMSIDSLLEPIEIVEDRKMVLTIQIVPVLQPIKVEKKGDNITDISLNYHFPINKKNGPLIAHETIDKYLEILNQEVDDRVDNLVVGDKDE